MGRTKLKSAATTHSPHEKKKHETQNIQPTHQSERLKQTDSKPASEPPESHRTPHRSDSNPERRKKEKIRKHTKPRLVVARESLHLAPPSPPALRSASAQRENSSRGALNRNMTATTFHALSPQPRTRRRRKKRNNDALTQPYEWPLNSRRERKSNFRKFSFRRTRKENK